MPILRLSAVAWSVACMVATLSIVNQSINFMRLLAFYLLALIAIIPLTAHISAVDSIQQTQFEALLK